MRLELIGGVTALLLTACLEHPSAPPTQSSLASATMIALTPANVDTTVGSVVTVTVQVNDKSGNPIADVMVEFSPTKGNYVSRSSTTADGRVSANWQVPTVPGTYTLVATVLGEATLRVAFNAHVTPGAPARLEANLDTSLAAAGGATFYPGVHLRDLYNNAVAGVSMSFATGGSDGGTVEHTSAVTDSSGFATPGRWTIGTAVGAYTLTASVPVTVGWAPSLTFTTHVPAPFSVTTMAAGEFSSCAIDSGPTSATYCWGAGFEPAQLGQAGLFATLPAAIPNTPALVGVTVGYAHACGLTAAGMAYCWGDNSNGQAGGPASSSGPGTIHAVPGQVAFKQLAAGRGFTCGLALDGSAWCWGDNAVGELGNGTRTNSGSPVRVSGGLAFASLAAGDQHACGLTTAANAWCWGLDDVGQLGAPGPATCHVFSGYDPYYYYFPDSANVSCALAPVAATGAPQLTSISASNDTCGLATDGSAVCWGQSVKSAVTSYGGPAAFVQVVAAGNGLCALTVSGDVYCGGGQSLSRAGPAVAVRSLTAGLAHQCAVTRDSGVAYCWGENSDGQLGNGTLASSTAAVPVAAPIP